MKKKKVLGEQTDKEEQELSEQDPKPVTQELEGQENGDLTMPAEELSLEEQIESLQSSLAEKTAKAEEYLDGWQRSRAEFANYKKRVLKENTEIYQNSRGEVINIYLDILDDLNRALDEKPTQGEGKIWAEGIELIVQKLTSRLETDGVKPMNPLGQEFDPNIHEALMKEESDQYQSGHIIEVMQEGYWIGEKVLRPALVRVAA